MTRLNNILTLRGLTVLGAAGILACGAITTPASAEEFALIDLGTLGGNAEALAMNDDGVVVGWVEVPINRNMLERSRMVQRAFMWKDGRMTVLPTLGGQWAEARDVNVLGEIVGVGQTWNERGHAFVVSGGVIYDLNERVWDDATPDNPRFVELLEANAINDDSVIVGCCTVPNDVRAHAYMLTPLPVCGNDPGAPIYTFEDLGRLPKDGDGIALDVNNEGEIVGTSGHSAFLWARGRLAALEMLGESIAYAVNENCVAAGSLDAGPAGVQPCLWTENGARFDLQMPRGWIGEAQGLNDRVDVVGWATSRHVPAPGRAECFVYQTTAILWRQGIMYQLDQHVDLGFAPVLRLERAVDIDEAGRIVGSGRAADGTWHPFLLVPVN